MQEQLKVAPWQEYRQYFPKKYWDFSFFDNTVGYCTKNFNSDIATILDIGSGVATKSYLKRFKNYYSLDPYIEKQETAKEILNWDNFNKNKYDFYICRGAINYLTIEQLKKIQENMKPTNVFVFNTFKNTPEYTNFNDCPKKEFINLSGQTCYEQAILEVRNGVKYIEHKIILPNSEINHNFYYYSQDEFNEIFPNVIVMKNMSKPNSLILIYKK